MGVGVTCMIRCVRSVPVQDESMTVCPPSNPSASVEEMIDK